ncbi:MAG: hypothetical protein JWO12_2801, partial [Frankiales bacterium]|nr:hypothetical protein [Frankiales bacterium]
ALAVPLEDLVDGLRQITTDDVLRQRLTAAGPVRAADFSWDTAAASLWRAYGDLPEGEPRQA